MSQAISELPTKRRTIEIEPLLQSTEKSWGKVDMGSEATEQGLEDPDGPFDLAVAIIDSGEGERPDTRAVVIASSWFLNPSKVGFPYQGTGNENFVPNTISWLQDREELISIRPKNLLVPGLYKMRQVHFWVFAGITVILIPLIILGAGLGIWLRRRHL